MATIDGYYFRVCTQSLERFGFEKNEMLLKVGIDPEGILQQGARGSVESMAALVRLIWNATKDEAMGYTGEKTPIGSFAFAASLALEGDDVCDGVSRALKFYNLVNQSVVTKLEVRDDGLLLTYRFTEPERDPAHYFSEFWMITIHRLACWLAGETLPITSASFDYPSPVEYIEEFKYLFPCEHFFDADTKSMLLDRHVLSAPIRRFRHELEQLIDEAPLELMTIPASDVSLNRRVRRRLTRSPGVTAVELSKDLGLSIHQLRREMRKEGLNLSQMREFVRRDRAVHMLVNSNASVESIAETLEFSEARSFTRAFRKWTGQSPSGFRQSRNTIL